jgi:hypothetical protein
MAALRFTTGRGRARGSSAVGRGFLEFRNRVYKTPPMANREPKFPEIFSAEPSQEVKFNVILNERFRMLAETILL